MKNIFNNQYKLKAVYLLWATFHIILFVISGNFISKYKGVFLYEKDFYPFSSYSKLKDYDASELIVYLIIPLSLYYFIQLWQKRKLD